MDKLRAMAGFVRIVEKGSLTAAAAELGVSLPSMVRTLAMLERELGVTLINRTTRRLHLTDEGAQYLEQCRAILGQVQEAETKLSARRLAPSGKLRVTASMMFGQRFVAPVMSEFVRRHAGVTGELLLVDRVVNLVEEGVDAAVRIGHAGDASLSATRLGEVRRVVCASPEYLRAYGTPRRPEDLRSHRCVRFTGLAPREEWTFRARPRKVAINCVLICNQADAAIEACVDGVGVGLFLSYMVADLARAGRLKYLLQDFETGPLPVQLLYPHSRMLLPTVRAFADLCLEKLGGQALD